MLRRTLTVFVAAMFLRAARAHGSRVRLPVSSSLCALAAPLRRAAPGRASRLVPSRPYRAGAGSSPALFASCVPFSSTLRRNRNDGRPFSTQAGQNNDDPTLRYALVQGASRGIGLEMARQLLEKGYHVMATCRNPERAASLSELAMAHPGRLKTSRLDVTDEESITRTAENVRSEFGGVLDILVNSAGVLQDEEGNKPERQLSEIKKPWMVHSMEVNTVGPVLVVQAMQEFLKRPRKSSRGKAVIANISARVGSIEDNKMGGWYSYRMSKSALNMATRCMSLELKRHQIAVISLHPGTVATDFTKDYRKNVKPEKLFTVERAATQLLDIVEATELTDTGKFYGWDREVIPF